MEFYSHAKEVNGEKIGSKLLKKHLFGVLQKSILSHLEIVNFDFSQDELKKIIEEISKFHDLGKYTNYFQNYLLGKNTDNELKNHARIGAFAILNKNIENPLIAALQYFIIKNHHSSFDNLSELDLMIGDFKPETIHNFEKQVADLRKNIKQISEELSEPNLTNYFKVPETKIFRKTIKNLIKQSDAKNYFLINYLFSLLIESDKLDASETKHYTRKGIDEKSVENYIGKVSLNNLPTLENIKGYEQNKLRNYVRAAVIENLNRDDILGYKIFTLTAPTGIGKTLTSLDFALRLKKKIKETENHESQIIYGLPFINIIEQGLKVYTKNVFNKQIEEGNINILAHYQYADVFSKENERIENSENEDYNQKLMELNTWQSDIVITSFVQFFETIISNRNKMLLKFNHLAGAIVILDEVQTLQLEKLPFIGAVLYYLSKFLNTRLILMTATKPKIFELAEKNILSDINEKITTLELLKENEQVFAKFNRTKIVPLIDETIVSNEDFYNLFDEKRPNNKSCLIVCNTVQRSIDVFKELKKNNIAPLYYLSTNIVPAVRLEIIENIKIDIAEKKHPVLVSTQVVEAGVDLDFDMGFRDLAPIDSIVQVAGRINRENDKEREGSPLYIIEFEKENGRSECKLVYDTLTRTQVLKVLKNRTEIPESDYLEIINRYFNEISDISAFDKSREFFEALKKLKYKTEISDERAINKFRIIEDANWSVSVFIELNDEAKAARNAYNKLLSKELSKEEFDKDYKKTFNQYIIAIPEKFTNGLANLNEFSEKIKLVCFDNLNDNYDIETGFIREGVSDGKTVML